ncbi:MAG: dihydropteroate synthase [Bacteroidetes bacterium]|nr:dihydropteroate synthase [Bacteroidota bacterium]MCL2302420.1 dihydropteroate synthase [Lentimicrobiaceae bacterium]
MKSICLNQKLISLNTPIIMGILNITEDSFFDGGSYVSETAVLKRVEQMVEEGASIIDLGAVSTRPNAIDIDENQELKAIKKHLRLILSHFPELHISVDTFRAHVADMAIQEGAALINDVSGGADPVMFDVVGKHQVPYILTHNNRSAPLSTKELISNMLSFFGNNIEKLILKGVKDIIIDPGFGFGKTVEQNYYLIKHLETFSILNFPILVGISRKSMIQHVLKTSPAESLCGTIALNTISLYKGTSILRVHDVKQCAEATQIFNVLHSL